MQSNLKNCKTKKQIKNKLSQRGGSGKASGRPSGRGSSNGNLSSSSIASNSSMPSAFYELQLTVFADKFPPAPKYIPHFNITVRIEEVQELEKIFADSPVLNKLIDSYKQMHLNLLDKYFDPQKIRKALLEANSVLARMIELLKVKYINPPSGNPEQALKADKWYDYIQKLVESNNKNITEINEYHSPA